MIIPDQKNLKVHFAGLENHDFAMVLHQCSGIRYSLFTVFPFIAGLFGIKALKMKTVSPQSPLYLDKASRHCIMDSGLFTLMFGAHAGKRDAGFISSWQDALVDFVLQTGYKGTIVEVDCQKVLGVDAAWQLRKRLKNQCPNRQINVFHKEDGQVGLDRLIEFSNYIAISVPELRITNKKTHRQDVIRLSNYIKNKKPTIDIHLLGCTDGKILTECSFCTSSDSTSWQQVGRYGYLVFTRDGERHRIKNKNINTKKLMINYTKQIKKILDYHNIEMTEKRFDYYSKYALAGALLKDQYSSYAGSQE